LVVTDTAWPAVCGVPIVSTTTGELPPEVVKKKQAAAVVLTATPLYVTV
jgi:hypothetical protein